MWTNIKDISFQNRMLLKFILKIGIPHVMLKFLIRTKFARLYQALSLLSREEEPEIWFENLGNFFKYLDQF